MQAAEVGIIGGSGLYTMPGLTNISEQRITTPFGDPSGRFRTWQSSWAACCVLSRHGRGHLLLPSELNFRANIFAMKMLGVEDTLSLRSRIA